MIAALLAAWSRLARMGLRWVPAVALAALVAALLVVGPAQCRKGRSQAAQGRLAEEQGSALGASARDAVAVQGRANHREQQSETLSSDNQRDIRNAKGADSQVDPHVRDAGLAGLCRREAYRGSERCKLLGAAPGRVAGGGRRSAAP